jgi:mxaJ protein
MYIRQLAAIVLIGAVSAGALSAETGPLKVCAAQEDLPYSGKDRRGFENKIAEVIAAELGRSLEFVWSERDAIYLVRDYLDKGVCDVVMGLDSGDPQVLTTKPYYRSGYVFIYRKDWGLVIRDWHSPALQQLHKFAIIPGTPAEALLKQIGKYEENFNYMHSLADFKSRRNQYVRFDPERLVREVADGRADIAILWGPLAARYVKNSSVPLEMTLIPEPEAQTDVQNISYRYDQSIGVRKGETVLVEQLNRALERANAYIRAILEPDFDSSADIGQCSEEDESRTIKRLE